MMPSNPTPDFHGIRTAPDQLVRAELFDQSGTGFGFSLHGTALHPPPGELLQSMEDALTHQVQFSPSEHHALDKLELAHSC
jgi:hypothetical protein